MLSALMKVLQVCASVVDGVGCSCYASDYITYTTPVGFSQNIFTKRLMNEAKFSFFEVRKHAPHTSM